MNLKIEIRDGMTQSHYWRLTEDRYLEPDPDRIEVEYDVPLDELREADGLARWIVQLMDKNWVSSAILVNADSKTG
ncbi:MAG: hypothetical protein AB7O66_24015 [Limisphaerales bacterium]